MVPKHIEVHPDYENRKENNVPVSGQEDYWNCDWSHPCVDFVFVVEICWGSPKSKSNDVQRHNDQHEENTIYDHTLFQKYFAPSIENCQVEVPKEVNLNLELVEKLNYQLTAIRLKIIRVKFNLRLFPARKSDTNS